MRRPADELEETEAQMITGYWAGRSFRVGDELVFRHSGRRRACRVLSPPWMDNTGRVVEILILEERRVVRCHDTDLELPSRPMEPDW